MIGATGAVGSHVVKKLVSLKGLERLTLLGRRHVEGLSSNKIEQHSINILNADSYADLLAGHQTAICTLGVGQPSTMTKQEFVKIDKDAVINFASACRQADVRHFELLSSVGATSQSLSFYLRTKGQLEDHLKNLKFERLSLFHPSMILTPTNRYGFTQAVTLFAMPLLNPILAGPLRKFRGIPVETLGASIAINVVHAKTGAETLHWQDFVHLTCRQLQSEKISIPTR
jgi:uncharacterized protein YbjT (DUF2867 family)